MSSGDAAILVHGLAPRALVSGDELGYKMHCVTSIFCPSLVQPHLPIGFKGGATDSQILGVDNVTSEHGCVHHDWRNIYIFVVGEVKHTQVRDVGVNETALYRVHTKTEDGVSVNSEFAKDVFCVLNIVKKQHVPY